MREIIIGRLEKDREKYGLRGCVLLGKQFIKMGRVTALSNKMYLDVATSHVVFICGKRGGGKCVLPDTKVVLADFNEKSIIDIYDEFKNSEKFVKRTAEEEIIKITKPFEIVSVDKNRELTKKQVEAIYRKKVNENLLIIKTNKNKKIVITKEHPLLVETVVESNNQLLLCYQWVRGELLKQKDKIAVYEENNIKIEEIEKIEKHHYNGWVYDLTIKDTHNFIGNSIICHNSYTMGVIAEGMADLEPEIKQNLSFIFLDTMGVYWTMKYPNKPDEALLEEWGLKGKPCEIVIYTPYTYYEIYKERGIPTDKPFSIKPSELDASDWHMTFDISPNDPIGVLTERIIHQLKKQKKEYSIDDIIKAVQEDTRSEQQVRDAVENRFRSTEAWGVFSIEGTPINELAKGGQITVLDVSCYATMPGGWKIKHLIVGIISNKLFIQRMIARKEEEYRSVRSAIHYFTAEEKAKLEMPLVWLIIDEAHEFLPRIGKTPATEPLVTIMREGRQPGISLIMATQQPGKIHTDAMTQSDTVISHRLTAKIDVEALGMLMQSYMRQGLDVELNNLPRVKGAAIIFDDSNEKMYPMRVRPRFTWHGGAAPYAIKEKKKAI